MYHYDKKTDLSFEETIIKTAEELKKEGFTQADINQLLILNPQKAYSVNIRDN